MKGHLFFNTWCAASMLAELLANVETETDIIVVDRGIMDALVWLNLQAKRGEVTPDEAKTIESFLLLDRWRGLFDLAVVMNVSADKAMSRENSARITAKSGSVMNPNALTAVTESVADAIKRYESKFPKIITHDTAAVKSIRESLADLAVQIVDSFQHFLNPDVLVVPKKNVESLVLDHGGAFDSQTAERAIDIVRKHGHFILRKQAEESDDQVQIVACGYLEHFDEIFLFERTDTDPKSGLYGKTTILQGSHVWKQTGMDIPEHLELSLTEKLSQSLFLSRQFPTKAIGYCWDKDNAKSSHHLGIVYRVTVDNEHTALNLKQKEFRKGRGHGLTGQFHRREQLTGEEIQSRLESWSRAVLHGLGLQK